MIVPSRSRNTARSLAFAIAGLSLLSEKEDAARFDSNLCINERRNELRPLFHSPEYVAPGQRSTGTRPGEGTRCVRHKLPRPEPRELACRRAGHSRHLYSGYPAANGQAPPWV